MQTKETEKRRPGKRRGSRYKVLLIASLCTFAVLSSSLTGTVLMRRHEAANAAELAELYHAPQSPSAQEINVSVDTAFEIPERFRELYEINPDIICMVDNCYGEFVTSRSYSGTMSFISTTISAESTAASARFSPTRKTPTGSTRHI